LGLGGDGAKTNPIDDIRRGIHGLRKGGILPFLQPLQPISHDHRANETNQFLTFQLQGVVPTFHVPERFDGDVGLTQLRFIAVENVRIPICQLAEIRAFRPFGTRRELAKMSFYQPFRRRQVHITDHHQNHFFRPVPGIVIGLQEIAIRLLQNLFSADGYPLWQ